MSAVRLAAACVVCALVLAPTSRGSPGQLLQLFISLAEVASGQPRASGTGCGAQHDHQLDAAGEEYLRIINSLSEVAVVLDEEGHRPGGATGDSADLGQDGSGVDLQSRSFISSTPNRKKCPHGQLPDRMGKCRQVVFDSAVGTA